MRAAAQDEEFAVFRFTLGIPGFDDEDIPRVVGFIGASLLVANHLASTSPPEAQVREAREGEGGADPCLLVWICFLDLQAS